MILLRRSYRLEGFAVHEVALSLASGKHWQTENGTSGKRFEPFANWTKQTKECPPQQLSKHIYIYCAAVVDEVRMLALHISGRRIPSEAVATAELTSSHMYAWITWYYILRSMKLCIWNCGQYSSSWQTAQEMSEGGVAANHGTEPLVNAWKIASCLLKGPGGRSN